MRKRSETDKHSMPDLFLILLFVTVLIGAGARIYGLRVFAEEPLQQPFLIELESPGVDSLLKDCLALGEILYLSDGTPFGSITSIDVLPLREIVFEGGSAYVGEWDTALRCRVKLTLECTGTKRSGLFLAGGKTPIGIGESLTLIGAESELEWRMIRVSDAAEQGT